MLWQTASPASCAKRMSLLLLLLVQNRHEHVGDQLFVGDLNVHAPARR